VKKHMLSLAAAAFLVAGASSATAQVVKIATGAQGSLAFSSGQAVAKVANANGIVARAQPLVGYLPLIDNAEVDFGFANGAETAFAFTGSGNYDRKHPNLRLVGVMFSMTTGLMAPCDLGLQSINDVKAKAKDLRIASGYTSSTIIPYYIAGGLATAGLSYGDLKRVPVASFVAGINALGDGLVDIALVSLNNGAGKKAAVKLKGRGGLCYVSLNDSPDAIKAMRSHLPASAVKSFPKNPKINGLENYDANIMTIPWMLMSNSKTNDDLVYNMVKAVAENKDDLTASFPLFRGADKASMAPGNDMPYHPGALRYYKEAGISVGN